MYYRNTFRSGYIKLQSTCTGHLSTGLIAFGILHQKKQSTAVQEVYTTSKTLSFPYVSIPLSSYISCFPVHFHLKEYKLFIGLCLKWCSPGEQPQGLLSRHVTLEQVQAMLNPRDAVACSVEKSTTTRTHGAVDYKLIYHSWKTAWLSGPTIIFFSSFPWQACLPLETSMCNF